MRATADKNPRELIVGEREGRAIRILNQLCIAVMKFCHTYKLNEPLRLKLIEAGRLYEMTKTEHN